MFYQGGVLGVGTPEVLVIAAVGYFLLGPEELYRLSKEIGKVVGQAREYVTKSAAEWQATLDGETFEFKEVKEIQAAAQELQDAFNFRSARYSNDYSNFNTGEEQNYTPPEESENPQLDVDDWNAKIMANEASAAPAASQMSAAPPAAAAAPAAAVASPPMTGTKAERLAEVERLYEAKRRALELEFGYEREKLAILLEEEDEEELSAAAVAAADRFEAAAEEAPAAPAAPVENPPTLSSSDLPY
jgi:Sec-independent protein translocase protein TatA